MTLPVTTVIACSGLALSLFQLWYNIVRRGQVRMTRPTMVCFTLDGSAPDRSKVFLRTLLYSTGNRGVILEGMFLKLRWTDPETHAKLARTFGLWVFGEERLSRGSGLFVGPGGVAGNHHFVLADPRRPFVFAEQRYTVEVYAAVVGRPATKLHQFELPLSADESAAIVRDSAAVFFDWDVDARRYSRQVVPRPTHEPPKI